MLEKITKLIGIISGGAIGLNVATIFVDNMFESMIAIILCYIICIALGLKLGKEVMDMQESASGRLGAILVLCVLNFIVPSIIAAGAAVYMILGKFILALLGNKIFFMIFLILVVLFIAELLGTKR